MVFVHLQTGVEIRESQNHLNHCPSESLVTTHEDDNLQGARDKDPICHHGTERKNNKTGDVRPAPGRAPQLYIF